MLRQWQARAGGRATISPGLTVPATLLKPALHRVSASGQPSVCSTSGRGEAGLMGAAADWPRRCASTAAALAVFLASSGWAACGPALADYAPARAFAEEGTPQELVMSPEEARYDENLMTAEVRSFLQLLETKGNALRVEDLEASRAKLGFRRAADGRVSLQSRAGRWFSVKADLRAPGFLLLRDEADGTLHYLPPDDSGQLMQIDLSDDAVVAQLFSSGAWYDVMDSLKVQSGRQVVPLQMSAAEFRLTTSLLDGAEEEDEELVAGGQ